MAEVKNTFLLSKMNKDTDSRILQKGEYRDALNFRISQSESGDAGAGENSLSTKKLTNLNLGLNPKTLGMYGDEFSDKIYWFVKSDSGCYVLEWDNISQVSFIVLADTRDPNILNFNEDFLITGVNLLIDSDNNRRFLLWTDGLNPPRKINIERAKLYGQNNFQDKDISVIQAPPLYPPSIVLSNSLTRRENFLKDKFIQFSYRYKYIDGEYSSISPFSDFAFFAKRFSYDFNKSSNESMLNLYNAVEITFNTGDSNVVAIDVLAKRPNSNVIEVIETFVKKDKVWQDNQDQSFLFLNNKKYRNLDDSQLTRLYDNVPLKALSQELIGNRLVYGAYTENYDIVDCNGQEIYPDYSLSLSTEEITSLVPKKTLKTNRDYEAVISYVDEYGRMTTGLRSENNNLHIPLGNSITRNFLNLEINSKAPCFAKHYRVFIKESKREYDTIVPTLFFFQGNFIYFLIQAADVLKVNEGDFLLVKADTDGIKNSVVELRVLEIQRKEKDFIGEEDGGQPEGLYIKTSILNEDVRFDTASYSFYELKDYDQSENADRILNRGTFTHTIFKGTELDDLTATVTYTLGADLRYEVEIFSVGATDTFRWRTQSVDGVFSSWDDNAGAGYNITGAAQVLDADVSITFGATTGHSLEDKWLVKKNINYPFDENNRSYAAFIYPEQITIGSIITLKYYSKKEKSPDIDRFTLTFISTSDYANLEEWYYGDNIFSQIASEEDFEQTLDKFIFRYANVVSSDITGNIITLGDDTSNNFVMFIESRATSSGSVRDVYSDVFIEVRKLDQLPIFENERGTGFDQEIFYEIGRTYDIDENGNHLGFDENDTSQTNLVSAQLVLPVYNAFAWGNGFESYKIRDSFNGNPLLIDTRPSGVVDDYRQNFRIASLTYSQPYEQSTNFNGINEFNLSLANFKDLDDKYGKIRKLFSRDTNLVVFQEDKVLQVLFNKSVLFNADGTGNVSQSIDVLGQEIPYAGEYGIADNPESFAYFGNRIYFTDAKRGVVLRLSIDGLEEISRYGMSDWFRDNFSKNTKSKKIGAYDTYFDQYTLTLGSGKEESMLELQCGSTIYKTLQIEPFSYKLLLNNQLGNATIPYNITSGTAIISVTFNGATTSTLEVEGEGELEFNRDTLATNEAIITITPVEAPVEYSVNNVCPIPEGVSNLRVYLIVTNDVGDTGQNIQSRYKWGSSQFFTEEPIFSSTGLSTFKIFEGLQGTTRFPLDGSTIRVESFKDETSTGSFTDGNKLSYLVSDTEYTSEDVATIQSLATDLVITTDNSGGIPETNYGEFVLDRPNGTENLYLIWNYFNEGGVIPDPDPEPDPEPLPGTFYGATRSIGEESVDMGASTCALPLTVVCNVYSETYTGNGVLGIGDIVLNTLDINDVLVGGNQWYKIQVSGSPIEATYQINNSGVITGGGSLCGL